MRLSELKKHLSTCDAVTFVLQNGTAVPEHFHITEIGMVAKVFIDCGGTVRNEKYASFQLWHANDFEHRLKSRKLLDIIAQSEKVLGLEDLEIEVEYQSETIGRYGLAYNGENFVLVSKQTACLATDSCGIPQEKLKVNLSAATVQNSCKPGTGCC